MRYWNLKDGTLMQGTKLEYYCYKLQQLKDRKEELNKEFYNNKVSEYLEKIKVEMGLQSLDDITLILKRKDIKDLAYLIDCYWDAEELIKYLKERAGE